MQDRILGLRCKLKASYHSVHTIAHKAEQPLHMTYFALVYYNSHAAYGTMALLCMLAMLLAWERG